jgi:hypothetical protein
MLFAVVYFFFWQFCRKSSRVFSNWGPSSGPSGFFSTNLVGFSTKQLGGILVFLSVNSTNFFLKKIWGEFRQLVNFEASRWKKRILNTIPKGYIYIYIYIYIK